MAAAPSSNTKALLGKRVDMNKLKPAFLPQSYRETLKKLKDVLVF